MKKATCHCNPKNSKWHDGCAHFHGSHCRLMQYPNDKCVMTDAKYCWKCCPFLQSDIGKLLLVHYNEKYNRKYHT